MFISGDLFQNSAYCKHDSVKEFSLSNLNFIIYRVIPLLSSLKVDIA